MVGGRDFGMEVPVVALASRMSSQMSQHGYTRPKLSVPSSPTSARWIRKIIAASVTTETSIPTSLPPTIHRFLNARNETALQDDCSQTYAGNNIHLHISF